MTECFICYKQTNDEINTACNHKIHSYCLIIWLLKNNSCPICRKKNPIHEYYLYNYIYNNNDLLQDAIENNNVNFVELLLYNSSKPINLKCKNNQINILLALHNKNFKHYKNNKYNLSILNFFIIFLIFIYTGFACTIIYSILKLFCMKLKLNLI
jgi:hypothetical protein